jgi:fibronectin type 3 domain-containing protein
MKRIYFLLIGLLMLSYPNIWAENTAQIFKTDQAPTIDGVVDAIWGNAEKIPIANLSNEGTGDPTVEGTWSASWDDDNIYFLVEVKDDIAMNNGTSDGSTPWYLHDCIEIFTDMNNTKGTEEVTNSNGQYQLRFIYGLDDEPIFENPDMFGSYSNASADNSAGDGYVLEIIMPWDILTDGMTDPVTVAQGLAIGLDLKLTDMYEDHAGDWWPSHYEYAWNSAAEKKPVNFGTVTLGGQQANIISTNASPVIDGVVDGLWANAEKIPIATLSNEGTGDPTVEGTWSALWDNDNVYFLIEVIDDIAMNNGSSDGSTPWYLHDCIEIFTDMNNKKNVEEVPNSDGQYQLRFIYGLDDEPIFENPDMFGGYSNASADNTAGDGYVIEISMPWDTLIDGMADPVTIAEGLTIGLDLKLTDMDEDHAGDWWPSHYEYAWNSAAGKSPAAFGTVTLVKAPYKKAQVWSTGTAPDIDGDIDPVWDLAEKIDIAELSNEGDGDPTVSGSWSALWDDSNIYFLFEVEDDIAMNNGSSDGSTPWYLHDCIEIFTDMNNKKNEEEVTNSDGQYQLRFIYGLDDEPIFENPTMTGYENVSKDNAAGDGYVIEVSMPWSALTEAMTDPVTLEDGLEIGMDFKLTDMDEDHAGNWWPPHYEYAWNNAGGKIPANFGSIILKKSADTEAPAAPANLAGDFSDEDKTITLTWDAAIDNEGVVSYNVYDGDDLVENLDALTVSYNLDPGTTYEYTVTAMDAAGNESDPSNMVSVTTTGVTPLPDGTIIGKTATAPTIDGEVEALWDDAPQYIISPFGAKTEPVTHEDFSATFRAKWDNDNLYLLFEVMDDILVTNPKVADGNTGGFYVHDCVELFIGDEDNTQSYHYRFIYNLDDEVNFDPVPAGYTNVSASTEDGYNIEVAIPWANLANDSMTMPEFIRAAALNFSLQVSDVDVKTENPGWGDIATHSLWPIGGGMGVLALANAGEVDPDTEAPAPPTNVMAEAHSVLPQITVTWDASTSDDVQTYHVMQGDVIVAAGTEFSATAIGLDPETEYSFTVVAVDALNYSTPSDVATATTAKEIKPKVAKIPKTTLSGEEPFYQFDMGSNNGVLPVFEIDRKLDGVMEEGEFYPSWSAVWNEEYLYLRVIVLDDVIFNGNENTWQNDQISIYFDMWNDNSKENPASTHPPDAGYQDDCMQYRVIAMDNDTKSGSSQEYDIPCTDANCHPDEKVGVLNWTGVEFLSYVHGQNEGYVVDIQWPWSSLGCVFDGGCMGPEEIVEGFVFGFDIDATDYDEADNDPDLNGIQAANSSMWSTWSPFELVEQHRNNSEWGDIELVLDGVAVGAEESRAGELSVYPNPARDLIYVSIPGDNNFDRVEIMDLSGRVVLSQSVKSVTGTASLKVDQLQGGIYLINLYGDQQILNAKVIVE